MRVERNPATAQCGIGIAIRFVDAQLPSLTAARNLRLACDRELVYL